MTSQLDILRAALLMVDVQRDFVDADGALAQFSRLGDSEREHLIGQWRDIVELVRSAGRPIVWVKTELRRDAADSSHAQSWMQPRRNATGAFLVAGTRGAEIIDGVGFEQDDYVVVKKGHSAYTDTTLDRLLENLGVEQCIVAGGGTEDSISETARTGGRLAYEQFVIEDALYPARDTNLRIVRICAELINVADFQAAANAPTPAPAGEDGPEYAMVLVDMQNDFMNNDSAHVKMGLTKAMSDETRSGIINATLHVMRVVRERGWPVIYVRVVRRADNLDDVHTRTHRRQRTVPKGLTHCVEETDGAEIVAELEPSYGDFMVEKKGGSGFGYTPLHRILRNLNVRRLLMTGGATTGCVWATVLDGVALGYDITVVGDATYPAEPTGRKMLEDWCTVRTSAEVVAELNEVMSNE
jgi:ureidoacrylate peracid hydrolase